MCCLSFTLTLAGLGAPPGARADGALTRVGSELRYDSDSQDAENLVISRPTAAFECSPTSDPAAAPCLQFANSPQNIRDLAAGCVQVTPTVVACSPPTLFTSIFLKLDDGDDFVKVLNAVPPTTMDGSFGNDDLDSRNGADTALGGPGDDTIFNDSGDDVLDGGADNDAIFLGSGDEDVIGGPGNDTVTLGSGDDTVRLDDIANDGSAGEAKNIHTDVEVIDGDGGSDNLFGNAAANRLIGGSGNDLIDGGGGPDVLEGSSGADELNGGPDFDRVVYSDSGDETITLDDVRNDGVVGELDNVHSDIEDVSAGAGDDVVVGSNAANVLEGGAGNDRLDGRGGVDTFFGGSGADTLLARDGLLERVDCGAQTDAGEADTIDLLVDCEGVALSSALVPDVDGDGATKPSDCDDANAAIHPGASDTPENGIDEDCSGADAVILDRDGDGFPRPADCNDADRNVHPGATDRPGNRVDEDCKAGDAPFPVLTSTVGFGVTRTTRSTVFTDLFVRRVPLGATIRLRCRGGGCRFKSKRISVKRARAKLSLRRHVRGARLRPGARLRISVTLPETVGVDTTLTVRKRKNPSRRDACLVPGATRASRCAA
jgi:hypothetical protein